MKLAKLSLAAIMAVGVFSVANATPLESAIKNVDLSGFMRYRWYGEDGAADAHTDRNRFSGEFLFTVPAGDNLSAGVSLKYENNDYATNQGPTTEPNVSVNQAWFKYAAKSFSVKAGRQVLATPWTDGGYNGSMADGAIGMYTGVPGWTFALAGFTQTNIKLSLGNHALTETAAQGDPVAVTYNALSGADLSSENLYAVAAIGSVGPVNTQVWLSRMTHVFDYSAFVQADMKMAGFGLKAQVNQLKLTDKGSLADDTGLFWAVQGSYAINGFGINAGYLTTDKDMPIYTLKGDNKFIGFGKQLYYETTNMPDTDTYFANLSYAMDAYSVGAGYGKAKMGSDDFADEYYLSAGYKYSKHFGMSAYYSDLDVNGLAGKADNKEIRFEAKYSF